MKVIEHGQLVDGATVKFLARKGVWLSTQILDEAGPEFPPLAREKKSFRIIMTGGKIYRNTPE